MIQRIATRLQASWLNETGHDALHAFDLPGKYLPPYIELIACAMQDARGIKKLQVQLDEPLRKL